jgi:hypothetical protein
MAAFTFPNALSHHREVASRKETSVVLIRPIPTDSIPQAARGGVEAVIQFRIVYL